MTGGVIARKEKTTYYEEEISGRDVGTRDMRVLTRAREENSEVLV